MSENHKHLVNNLESVLDSEKSEVMSRRDVPVKLIQKSTPTMLVKMVMQEWIIILLLSVTFFLGSLWLCILAIVFIAGRYHALGVIIHDATHMSLQQKSILIRFVEVFAGYPIATTLNAMRYHHLRHHRDSGMQTDPYYKRGKQGVIWWTLNTIRGVFLVPFWNLRAIIGGIAFFVPSLRNLYAHIFLQDRSDKDLRNSVEVIDCARAEWGQIVFLVALVFLTTQFPTIIIVGYFLPVSIAGIFAARRLLVEHNYELVKDRKIETIIAITNDNHLGVLGSLFLAPRNIGYHIVHHIHPQVGLHALPQLREWYINSYGSLYVNKVVK